MSPQIKPIHARFECIPCFMRQTVEAVRLSGVTEEKQKQAINKVLRFIENAKFDITPPILSQKIFQIIVNETGCPDPFRVAKERYNSLAQANYSLLKKLVYTAKDPVRCAALLAVAANITEIETGKGLQKIIENVESLPVPIDDYNKMIEDFRQTKHIIYLIDNAGEIVFDKLFIEVLKRFYPERDHHITVIVRDSAIANDATIEDARLIQMEELAEVVSDIKGAPAFIMGNSLKTRRIKSRQAGMIISKGQGNFEALSGINKNIYFLLRVKCSVISEILNVPVQSLVIKSA